MSRRLGRFLRTTDAATAVEYAVVLALILMVVFSAVALVGQKTGQSWSNSNTSLQAVNFGS
jgi:Flp pilus assembly pilin Flp